MRSEFVGFVKAAMQKQALGWVGKGLIGAGLVGAGAVGGAVAQKKLSTGPLLSGEAVKQQQRRSYFARTGNLG